MRLGALYKTTKDFAKSESAYRNALALGTNSMLVCNELANVLVANKGNLDEALAFATKAVELGNRSGVFLDTLGWVHYQRQEYPKALAAFQAAAQSPLNPQFVPEVRFHLGLAYHKTGDRAKAVSELQEVLKLAPAFPEADQVKALLKELEAP
jgi:tetratricopeptide (TPR) repeat protein